MKKVLNLMLVAIACVVASCTPKEIPTQLSLSESEVVVPASGITKEISFSSNKAWTVDWDANWINFDIVSGDAGDVTILMTVSANKTQAERSTVVTINSEECTTKLKVTQSDVVVFTSEFEYDIPKAGGVVKFSLNSNLEYNYSIAADAAEWIKIVPESKAAPVVTEYEFSVSENTGDAERIGIITITAGEAVIGLIVKQAGNVSPMTDMTVTYLSNSMFFYDLEEYSYVEYDEYYLGFKSGTSTVYLAVNASRSENPLTIIPTGTFAVDATGKHNANTFSVKGSSLEKYYTTIFEGSTEISIVDGEITIEQTDANYNVTATLFDRNGTSHKYTYSGPMGTVSEDSFAIMSSGNTFKGAYNTYFASKSNEWSVSFYVNSKLASNSKFIRYFSASFYGPSGEVSDMDNLPAGTYNFAAETIDESITYKNGKVKNEAFTFNLSGNTLDYEESFVATGGTVIVKDVEGGKEFSFDVTADFTNNSTEAVTSGVQFKLTTEAITLSCSKGPEICPNGDIVLSSSSSAVGFYFNDLFGKGGASINLAFQSLNNFAHPSITLPLYVKDWTYEKNYANRYCNTPITDGIYTVYKTSDTTDFNMIYPFRTSTGGVNATLSNYFENGYTGTIYTITDGTLTVSSKGTVFTFDLSITTVGEDSKTFKLTGELPLPAMYYVRTALDSYISSITLPGVTLVK